MRRVVCLLLISACAPEGPSEGVTVEECLDKAVFGTVEEGTECQADCEFTFGHDVGQCDPATWFDEETAVCLALAGGLVMDEWTEAHVFFDRDALVPTWNVAREEVLPDGSHDLEWFHFDAVTGDIVEHDTMTYDPSDDDGCKSTPEADGCGD